MNADVERIETPTDNYRPIQSNRFVAEIEGVDAFLISHISISPIKRGLSHGTTMITFLLLPNATTEQVLFSKLQNEPQHDLIRENTFETIKIKLLNRAGTVVKNIVMSKCDLQSLKISDMAYEDNTKPITCTAEITFNKIEIIK